MEHSEGSQTSDPGLPALALITHDSRRELERFLDSQIAVAERLDLPFFVVDNASSDGTIELLRSRRERFPRIEIRALPRNLGYSAAVNMAFEALAPTDVLLLNPDVELAAAEQVVELARALAQRPDAAVCAPRLTYPDGTLQPSVRRPASLPAMLGSLSLTGRVRPLRASYERYLSPAASSDPIAVDWAIGAAMLIRRRAYEQVGGWDEGFFLYMEDADFCRRCAERGWEVLYVPSVVLRHGYARASSNATSSVLTSPARRRHVASLARYWRKHPGALIGREARGPKREAAARDPAAA